MFEPPEERDAFGTPLSGDRPSMSDLMQQREAALRVTSLPVSALVQAVDLVLAQVPMALPGPQALADTAELLRQVERLRAGLLGRLADVEHRKLHSLDGAPTTSSWVDTQQTSLDRGQVALARRMSGLPRLEQAVREGRLSIAVAEQVGKSLSKLRRHLDRADGLIDGQDGEQALLGVIGHGVRRLACEALGGLAEDDPRLLALLADTAAIVGAPDSQYARLEAAFVLLARQVEPAVLPGALGQLVDALLPNELEKRAADGHANRGFGLVRTSDGTGYRITDGELDLECGELLEAVLAAELAVDPDNRPTQPSSRSCARRAGGRPTSCPTRACLVRGRCGSGGTTRSSTACAATSTPGSPGCATRSPPTWTSSSASTCSSSSPGRCRPCPAPPAPPCRRA
jgi:hypothetical protein